MLKKIPGRPYKNTRVLASSLLLTVITSLPLMMLGCAAPGAPSTVDTLVAQSAPEARPITLSAEKTLIGTWVIDGETLSFKANKNVDGFGFKTPGGGNIPTGMVMVDGVLARGQLVWEYKGDREGGTVFITADNLDTNEGTRTNFQIKFINDTKMIATYQGDTELASKIK